MRHFRYDMSYEEYNLISNLIEYLTFQEYYLAQITSEQKGKGMSTSDMDYVFKFIGANKRTNLTFFPTFHSWDLKQHPNVIIKTYIGAENGPFLDWDETPVMNEAIERLPLVKEINK